MKLSPINNVYNNRKTSFRSMSCEYKLPNNREMGLYTWMYRKDLDWENTARFILENFKDKDRVNIVQFAPSDGSEGYTMILSLLRANPVEAEKCFPIKAFDINKKIVEGANMGLINLSKRDTARISDNDIPLGTYFTEHNDYISYPDYTLYKVSDDLRNRIQFNIGNMFNILPKIKDKSNTIIMCRNCLEYYNNNQIADFICQASKVLKAGSLLLVGRLEETHFIKDLFNQHGFVEVLRNVYRKAPV